MKKIIISLSIIVAVGAIIIGGTIAYFSDTETSTGNTLTAGTLDLSVNGQNPLKGPVVTIEDLKPSFVWYSEPIKLVVHDNPGKLWKHIKDVRCDTGIVTEPECTEQGGTWIDQGCDWETAAGTTAEDKNYFPGYTWFDLQKLEADGQWVDVIREREGYSVEDFRSCWIPLGEYKPETGIVIRQSFHLDKNVTNWAQGDKCSFTEEFLVTQTNAPDPVTTEGRVWDPKEGKCVTKEIIL